MIYTLLDLMHKPDMFFILVAMTPCYHLDSLLEKRVISRLNAQKIFLENNDTNEVCELLSSMLLLSDTIPDLAYITVLQYNKSVNSLFGDQNRRQEGLLYGLIECCINWGYTIE